MNIRKFKTSCQKGFSLVELLVVIAVIAVIAAIVIPNIGEVNSVAAAAKNRRNAQSIASVFQSGAVAGITWNTTTIDAAIADVIAGKTPTSGAFNGRLFKVPGVNTDNATGAKTHLTLTSSGLEYVQ